MKIQDIGWVIYYYKQGNQCKDNHDETINQFYSESIMTGIYYSKFSKTTISLRYNDSKDINEYFVDSILKSNNDLIKEFLHQS